MKIASQGPLTNVTLLLAWLTQAFNQSGYLLYARVCDVPEMVELPAATILALRGLRNTVSLISS